MMKNFMQLAAIFLSGFITIPLMEFIPVAGGGEAMIVFLTVPFLIALALILSIVFYVKRKKIYSSRMFLIIMLVMIFLNLILFPHG